jgi:hypothetical protein
MTVALLRQNTTDTIKQFARGAPSDYNHNAAKIGHQNKSSKECDSKRRKHTFPTNNAQKAEGYA